MRSQFEVKDVAWDADLGAEKLDLILLNHFADEFQEKHGIDIRTFPKAVAKLKKQARLSCPPGLPHSCHTCIDITFLYGGVSTWYGTFRCTALQRDSVSATRQEMRYHEGQEPQPCVHACRRKRQRRC